MAIDNPAVYDGTMTFRTFWLLALVFGACASHAAAVANSDGPVAFDAPAPDSGTAPPPANPCSPLTGTALSVSTAADLIAALASATVGTTILLADGIYAGTFTTGANSGTAQNPIAICGSRSATLDGGSTASGTVLHITQSYWVVAGITVRNGQKGVVLDNAAHSLLTGILVTEIGDEGVHFRSNSSDNRLTQSEIRGTGKYSPGFGEGVYIGSAVSNWAKITGGTPDQSDRNIVDNNIIADTTAECVDIKEGSSFGVIASNRFDGGSLSGQNYADSWIDVKGHGYTITGNTGVNASAAVTTGFQVHVVSGDAGIIPNSGNDNVFSGNSLDLTGSSASAGISVQATATGNIVRCDNTVIPSTTPLLASGSCS